MKLNLSLIGLCIVLLFTACQKEDRLLLAGSGFKKIVELDKPTKEIIWEHDLQDGDECNQVNYTKDGNVFYAHKKGATLINKDHEILWSIKSEEKTEIQSASVTEEGNLLVGQCGNPAKIMEFSSKGEKLTELSFNLEQKRPHGQFRRVMKQNDNSYFVILLNGTILEFDGNASLVNEYKVAKRAFDMEIVNDNKWIVACGDSHELLTYNPTTKSIDNRISNDDLNDVKLKFVADLSKSNKNLLLANWGGHSKGTETQPQLIEFDENFNVVWQLTDNKIGNISAVGIK